MTKKTLAEKLRKAKDTGVDKSAHLVIEARAGTGKTTTLVEGLKRIKGFKSTLVPSDQQKAVWDEMAKSKGKVQTICFVAFNKSIATELKTRVPEGCQAMTMHSMGNSAIRRHFGGSLKPNSLNSSRVQEIIAEITDHDIWKLRKRNKDLLNAVDKLVGLCKMNLVGYTDKKIRNLDDELSNLAAYYQVELNGIEQKVFDLVPQVLERCKDVERDGCFDFNDMIWLPIALNLNVYRNDLLLIDESQDLNRCQQALAKKAGRRLILCGDPKQAIYGFAGADSESMLRMENELKETERGCVCLPLTVTRRCSKAIVREAQKYVPDFEAFETNPEGERLESTMKEYRKIVKQGDMVLCRVNAPLVSECFKFLKEDRKAEIQGRDIGAGLISTIGNVMKRHEGTEKRESIPTLIEELSCWREKQTAKEQSKKFPSETVLNSINDRHDCLVCFADSVNTVTEAVEKIETIFADGQLEDGIKLSSAHKSKGLEAPNVFILRPEEAPMPHPMAKTKWQREQEYNLLYVAITRTIKTLYYVF